MTDDTKRTDETIERLDKHELDRMRTAIYLLEPPAPDVCNRLIQEIDRLQSELHEMREREMTEEKAEEIYEAIISHDH